MTVVAEKPSLKLIVPQSAIPLDQLESGPDQQLGVSLAAHLTMASNRSDSSKGSSTSVSGSAPPAHC